MADPSHVGELLAEIFRRGGMTRAVRRAQAVVLWPQVAGRQLAAFTHARTVVDGVLVVEVPDSETAMHLTLQRQRFIDALRGRFGAREIRDIRFQPGRVAAGEPPGFDERLEVETPPDPAELASLARRLGELDLPEQLSKEALQAGTSMLAYRARRKAEGWLECPTCGALTPSDGLCVTCRRYSRDPLVQACAERLAVDPDSRLGQLSDDQRAVAVRLALTRLEGTMKELLPRVLADEGDRPQLEHAARCFLALSLAKPLAEVDEEDALGLPPQVARILGMWGGL